MKIVILVDALHSIAAGSERQIYKLIDGLAQSEHQVKLVLLRHTQFSETLNDFPCAIQVLNVRSLASFNALVTLRRFRTQLLNEGVEVVHAWLPESCLLAPLFLKHHSIKIFTSRRDMGLIYQGKPALLYRLLKGRTDAVIANSRAVAAHVAVQEGLPRTKSRVIYNGLDLYHPPASGTNTPDLFTNPKAIKLVLVANIKPVKRTLDAVKAVTQLIGDGFAVELALIGEPQDTGYQQAIKNHIAAAQAESAIHWLGSINEPRRLLAQADIGLLVSDSEGLSNTLMEYMQAGLPVIATEVGGNPELIQQGVNGILVQKGDISAIARAIQTLHSDTQFAAQCRTHSQQRIRTEFSIEHMIKQHLALYAQAAVAVTAEKAQC